MSTGLEAPWRAESLRLTLFSSAPLGEQLLDWWAQVAGAPPDEKIAKPAIGTFVADGEVGGGRLRLTVSINRVDWTRQSASADDPTADLGPVGEALTAFVEQLVVWGQSITIPVERIALGLVMRFEVDGRISGYRQLERFLHDLKVDADGSSDLVYQINRPRQSNALGGMKINRLSRWGVLLTKLLTLEPKSQVDMKRHYCRAELDVNTSEDNKNDLRPLFRELCSELAELALEVASAGDVR